MSKGNSSVIPFDQGALAVYVSRALSGLVATGNELARIKEHVSRAEYLRSLERIDIEPCVAEQLIDIAKAPAEQQRALALKALEDEAVFNALIRHARRA